jgi:hypothetical protein
VAVRGKNYDWGLGEFAFGMYCTAANLGLLLANNFVLAILGDAYSNQVRASDSSVGWRIRSGTHRVAHA